MSSLIAWSATPLAEPQPDAVARLALAMLHAARRRLTRILDGDAADALAALDNMLGRAAPDARAWTPGLGAAICAAKHGAGRIGLLHALLAAHELELAGSWSLDLGPVPVRAALAGHCFDLSGRVTADGSGTRLTIAQADEEAPLVFERAGQGWTLATQAAPAWARLATPAPFAGPGGTACYALRWDEPDNPGPEVIVPWPPGGPETFAYAEAVECAADVRAGLDVIEAHVPCFAGWIAPVLRGVAAAHLTDIVTLTSSSSVNHAGLFSCGFPVEPEMMGEILCHEMSHQHLLLLNAAFPLTDGSDQTRYWSSLKRLDRTIDRILLPLSNSASSGCASTRNGLSPAPGRGRYQVG